MKALQRIKLLVKATIENELEKFLKFDLRKILKREILLKFDHWVWCFLAAFTVAVVHRKMITGSRC